MDMNNREKKTSWINESTNGKQKGAELDSVEGDFGMDEGRGCNKCNGDGNSNSKINFCCSQCAVAKHFTIAKQLQSGTTK